MDSNSRSAMAAEGGVAVRERMASDGATEWVHVTAEAEDGVTEEAGDVTHARDDITNARAEATPEQAVDRGSDGTSGDRSPPGVPLSTPPGLIHDDLKLPEAAGAATAAVTAVTAAAMAGEAGDAGGGGDSGERILAPARTTSSVRSTSVRSKHRLASSSSSSSSPSAAPSSPSVSNKQRPDLPTPGAERDTRSASPDTGVGEYADSEISASDTESQQWDTPGASQARRPSPLGPGPGLIRPGPSVVASERERETRGSTGLWGTTFGMAPPAQEGAEGVHGGAGATAGGASSGSIFDFIFTPVRAAAAPEERSARGAAAGAPAGQQQRPGEKEERPQSQSHAQAPSWSQAQSWSEAQAWAQAQMPSSPRIPFGTEPLSPDARYPPGSPEGYPSFRDTPPHIHSHSHSHDFPSPADSTAGLYAGYGASDQGYAGGSILPGVEVMGSPGMPRAYQGPGEAEGLPGAQGPGRTRVGPNTYEYDTGDERSASSSFRVYGPPEPSPLTFFEPVFKRAQRYGPIYARRKLICQIFAGVLMALVLALALGVGIGVSRSQGSGNAPLAVSADVCVPRSIPVPAVGEMTLEEKIGQLLMVEQSGLNSVADISRYFLGAVLCTGGWSGEGNSAYDWSIVLDSFQAEALRTRLGVPAVFSGYAVHGHAFVTGTTVFPHHSGLGAAGNATLVAQIAAATTLEMAGTGVRWNLGPSASVCLDARWGRCYESFGERQGVVAQLVQAEIRGWQVLPSNLPENWTDFVAGISFSPGGGGIPRFVAATAKHYVGDGGAAMGRDGGDIEDQDAITRVHVPPFASAVGANVAGVLMSYGTYRNESMAASSLWLNEVLRQELEYSGLVLAHREALKNIPGDLKTKLLTAIQAGVDVFVLPDSYREVSRAMQGLVTSGKLPMRRVNTAVSRMLNLKSSLNLFQAPCAQTQYLQNVGSAANRALARQAVRDSLVLLKNKRRPLWPGAGKPVFPIVTEGRTVLVVGQHAGDIGLQCGGWTVTVQGRMGNITTGTTIFEGIRELAATRAKAVVYMESYDFLREADFGIVVVGELPYAQGLGDSETLELPDTSVNNVNGVCQNMPCLVVLVAGRPVSTSQWLDKADGLVMAWLPGTEGAGVADVILGDHEFTGSLPVTWPAKVRGPKNKEPLFHVGFGLTKESSDVVQ